MSLSVFALVLRSVMAFLAPHPQTFQTCSVTLNVTPSIAGASTATMVDTWEGLSECTSPAPPGSSAPTPPLEQSLMRAPRLSSLSVLDLATIFAGIAEASAIHAGNSRAQAEALLGLRAAWGLSLFDLALLAAIQRALHQIAFLSGVHLERAAKFQSETLGQVGNAAETALRKLSKSARTPPDAGQHGILDFFSLHLGVFDLLHINNLEPFADGTDVVVDSCRHSLVGTTDQAPVAVNVLRVERLPAHEQ